MPVALLASSASVFAALPSSLVDVNFYFAGNGGGPATGIAAVGGSSDIWNGFGSASTDGPFTLNDTLGQLSSVTLSYDIGATAGSGAANIQPNGSLMSDYAYSLGETPITLDIGGLDPDSVYNLYVYVSSNDASDGSRAIQVAANSSEVSATGDPQNSFVAGENYVFLTPTSDSSGSIHIRAMEDGDGNADQEIDINGFQLQVVPEPATCSFFALGAAAVGFATWARRSRERA